MYFNITGNHKIKSYQIAFNHNVCLLAIGQTRVLYIFIVRQLERMDKIKDGSIQKDTYD